MARLFWTQRQDMGPSPRWDHAMAYDSARGRTVLFGGFTPDFGGDTWEWNGELWTQVEDIGPSPRAAPAMAYDAARAQVILFGGNIASEDPNSVINGDTWAWDGEAWTQVADTGPPPQDGCGIAYDDHRERIVLFGGLRRETWEWDGVEWTQTADNGPSLRARASMAYDDVRERVALFGGFEINVGPQNDTWEFDGVNWTRAADTGPPPRFESAMVFAGTRTILFGGQLSVEKPVTAKDTWEWSGKHWTQRQNIGPQERSGHAMAYDANRDRVVLFGGAKNPNGQKDSFLNDTWELPGNRITLTGLFSFPDPLNSDGTGTIRLSGPAPIGGLSVSLSSTGPIQIPGSVSIAEGKTIEVFPMKPGDFDPTQATVATITAKLGGSVISHSVRIGAI